MSTNLPIPSDPFMTEMAAIGFNPSRPVDDPKPSVGNYGIRVEAFGAKGDGTTNDTQAILEAIALAKSLKEPLIFSGGKTYKFLPTAGVDITGIPEFIGFATIDCAGVNDKQVKALFKIQGSSQVIATGQKIDAGTVSLNIGGGLDLKANDTLYVTSTEPNDNPDSADLNSNKYKKGMLVQVRSYNSSSGVLIPFEVFRQSITSATIAKATNVPTFKNDKNLSYRAAESAYMYCWFIDMANVELRGDHYNFGDAAIYLGHSLATLTVNVFNASIAQDGVKTNYGVVIVDLSRVSLLNCYIIGGRHAVAGGGNFPSDYTINGGFYAIFLNTGCIDAHGNVWSISVSNCIIYEGVVVSANKGYFSNCNIFFKNSYGFQIASIFKDDHKWGEYYLTNCLIQSIGPTVLGAFDCKVASLTKLRLNKCTINTNHSVTGVYPFRIISSILDLEIDGLFLTVTGLPAGGISAVNVFFNDAVFNQIICHGCQMRFIGKADVLLFIYNSQFNDAPGNDGLRIEAFAGAEVVNTKMSSNDLSGAYFLNTLSGVVKNCIARNNNMKGTAGTSQKSGIFFNGVQNVIVQNNGFQSINSPTPGAGQSFGVYTAGANNYILQGNDARGCSGVSAANQTPFVMTGTRKSQLGNVANIVIPDILNT